MPPSTRTPSICPSADPLFRRTTRSSRNYKAPKTAAMAAATRTHWRPIGMVLDTRNSTILGMARPTVDPKWPQFCGTPACGIVKSYVSSMLILRGEIYRIDRYHNMDLISIVCFIKTKNWYPKFRVMNFLVLHKVKYL